MNIEIPKNCHPHDSVLVDGLKVVLNDLPKKIDYDLHDITFIVSDAPGWICEAGTSFRTIRINLKVLEVIYGYCFAYHEYYQKVCKGVKPDGQYVNLAGREELLTMRNVLSWATKNLTGLADSPYWVDPSFPDLSTQKEEASFKLYIGALSFYVVHEIMHLVLGMEPSMDEEKECDKRAAKVLMSNLDLENSALKNGVAIGLTLMNALGMHTGNYDGLTHPFAYDRLLDSLSPYCDPETDTVWDWIVAFFSLHMTENNIDQPKEEFNTFYECVVKYRSLLHLHRQKNLLGDNH